MSYTIYLYKEVESIDNVEAYDTEKEKNLHDVFDS